MIRAVLIAALLLATTAAEARYLVRWRPVVVWQPRHYRMPVPRPMTRAEMQYERCWRAHGASRIVALDCAIKYGVRVLP